MMTESAVEPAARVEQPDFGCYRLTVKSKQKINREKQETRSSATQKI